MPVGNDDMIGAYLSGPNCAAVCCRDTFIYQVTYLGLVSSHGICSSDTVVFWALFHISLRNGDMKNIHLGPKLSLT